MPGGDAQRVWFPEMVDRLRSGWHEGVPLDALVVLRDELDAMLGGIRSTRQIRTPITTCLRCGHTGRQPEPRVSVRALILALARFGIVGAATTRALERAWAAHRQQHGLDLYGQPAVPAPTGPCACGESSAS